MDKTSQHRKKPAGTITLYVHTYLEEHLLGGLNLQYTTDLSINL